MTTDILVRPAVAAAVSAPTTTVIDVEAVKRAYPMTRVASWYRLGLRPVGRALVGLCPFHDDRHRPNFHLYPDTDSWYCYACDRGGDVIDFVCAIEHVDFLGAVTFLTGRLPVGRPPASTTLPSDKQAQPRGSQVTAATQCRCPDAAMAARWSASRPRPPVVGPGPAARACLTAAIAFYHRQLLADVAVQRYLAGRGLDRHVVRRYQLGFGAGGVTAELRRLGLSLETAREAGLLAADGREFLGGRVIVPELRAGRPIWAIGRLLPPEAGGPRNPALPRYLSLPGPKPLFNWELARQQREVCLVEGPFDALVLAAWGVPALALVGTHASADARRALTGFRRIYVVMDADQAGARAARALVAALGDRGRLVSLAGLPGVKDPADLARRRDGPAILGHRLRAARALPSPASTVSPGTPTTPAAHRSGPQDLAQTARGRRDRVAGPAGRAGGRA
jgi:DNA primase